MSTLVTIQSTDLITNSRADINGNFSALNTDKMETSVLDTDTTLAANSDAKIPSQKAVKAYVDAGGNVNASDTTKGIVEEATDAEVLAGTAVGATGARLFINPSSFPTLTITPTITTGSASKDLADSTGTQTIAHGLGVAPTHVQIKLCETNSNTTTFCMVDWHTGGFYSSASWTAIEGSASPDTDASTTSRTGFRVYDLNGNTTRYQDATITVDATNITISWTKVSTPTGTVNFVWLARADSIVKS